MTELLTPDEFEAMDLLGQAANAMRRVIGDGDQAAHDWSEAADKIHQLQSSVMAQAAARAYPDKFRPLGGWPKDQQSELLGDIYDERPGIS